MNSLWLRGILVACLACALPMKASVAAPTSPADPEKVLRYVFVAPETGFDPAITRDLYSALVVQSVFETLFTYDYLARPAKLIPLTAPEHGDGVARGVG